MLIYKLHSITFGYYVISIEYSSMGKALNRVTLGLIYLLIIKNITRIKSNNDMNFIIYLQ